MPLVSLSAVRFVREGLTIVEGFHLRVDPGEIVGLAGPTRCGKTTLLHLVAGIERPSAGSISWAHTTSPRWADVSLVPQSIALIDELTVAENIDFARRATGTRQITANEELLESLDLDRLRDRLVGQISVGERQRTMVARALSGSARLILADEPTAHQDAHHGDAVLMAIRAAVSHDGAAIIATRDVNSLGNIADRIERLAPS